MKYSLIAACAAVSLCLSGADLRDSADCYWSFDTGDALKVPGEKGPALEAREKDPGKVSFVPGVSGKAVCFSGIHKHHFELPKGELQDLKPPFTIAVWIKKTQLQPQHTVICGTQPDPKADGFEFNWFWRSLNLRWGNGKTQVSVSTPFNVLAVNQWHHVAVVHDGKQVTFYVDAVAYPAKKTTQDAFLPCKSRKFTIGQYSSGFSAYQMVGMMDELFLFRRALSAGEVVSLAIPKKP